MNVKRKKYILVIGAILLVAAIIFHFCLPQEIQGIVLFFGGLGIVLLVGALLVVPICLLLVKYFQKR